MTTSISFLAPKLALVTRTPHLIARLLRLADTVERFAVLDGGRWVWDVTGVYVGEEVEQAIKESRS